jgi:hypothetical protein
MDALSNDPQIALNWPAIDMWYYGSLQAVVYFDYKSCMLGMVMLGSAMAKP